MRENYTYNWEILSITKKGAADKSNVIFKVMWRLIGIDPNGTEGVFKAATEFTIPNQFDNNFIDYENVTQEDIINWITQILNMEDVYSAIDDEMQKNKEQIETVTDGQYPWQQTSVDSPLAPPSPEQSSPN